MFTIATTDPRWVEQLWSQPPSSVVNFWTPTDWAVKSIESGSRVYFMMKSPVRLLGGYGEFSDYRTMSVADAWAEFGLANGVMSEDDLLHRVTGYASKRSSEFTPSSNPEIGALILTNPVFFDEGARPRPEDFGVEFPPQVVKFKTFQGPDPFTDLGGVSIAKEFELQSDDPDLVLQARKKRVGQSEFRKRVLDAYGSTCCISGTGVVETLQAAHIQAYVGPGSNHVQNGLCLRSDLHALFDRGWITICDDLTVSIAVRLKDTEYFSDFDGAALRAPEADEHRPSLTALRHHRRFFAVAPNGLMAIGEGTATQREKWRGTP